MKSFEDVEFQYVINRKKREVFSTRVLFQFIILITSVIITTLVISSRKDLYKNEIKSNNSLVNPENYYLDEYVLDEYENYNTENNVKNSFEEKNIEKNKNSTNKNEKLEVLGSYTTKMTTEREREKNRVYNIKKAAEYIDGIVINPGAEFSFHKNIWDCGRGKTYKAADAFSINGMDKGLGGGVCQLSSTLYIAALLAHMKIKERHPHSREVSYVLRGLDAAYATGAKDLVIINPYKYPVKIKAEVTDNYLVKVSLLSRQKKDFEVSIYATKVNETENETKTKVLIETKIKGNKNIEKMTVKSSYKK